jgi:hypothetical protein
MEHPRTNEEPGLYSFIEKRRSQPLNFRGPYGDMGEGVRGVVFLRWRGGFSTRRAIQGTGLHRSDEGLPRQVPNEGKGEEGYHPFE